MNTITTILSYGMGVESSAILLRWIHEPASRPAGLTDLSQLLVLTAQVGDEYPDTARDVDAHIVPLLRKHGIRWAQVSRAGASMTDGIVIHEDSTQPTRTFIEGAFKLSDELRANGTVPQQAGTHLCALKHKAWTLEKWLNDRRVAGAHAFGYNSDETSRVEKSEYAISERNEMAFGYNASETGRAETGSEYDTFARTAIYPLIEWGWSRERCIEYIRSVTGITWRKSACTFCPFNDLCGANIDRHREFPAHVAAALEIEHTALALNPRAALYNKKALIDITLAAGNHEAIAAFRSRMADRQGWSVYRVRRIYSGPGTAQRGVDRMGEVATEADAQRWLDKIAWACDTEIEVERGIRYAYRVKRTPDMYPAREEFYSVAPSTVATKYRYGKAKFDAAWEATAKVTPKPHVKKPKASKAKAAKKVAA